MPFTQSLASKQLKAWRTEQSLSQTEAAKRFEVSQPTYSEYETGRKTPRTVKALEIEQKTGGAVQIPAWAQPAPAEAPTAEQADPKDAA